MLQAFSLAALSREGGASEPLRARCVSSEGRTVAGREETCRARKDVGVVSMCVRGRGQWGGQLGEEWRGGEEEEGEGGRGKGEGGRGKGEG